MNREPINPLCLITKLVSLIEISCFSKRATPFCPIPARRLGLFLSLSLSPLPNPSTEGFLLRKSEGETPPRGERYLLQPFLPSRFLLLPLARSIRGFMRLVSCRVIRFHRRLALIASSRRRRPGFAFFRETREWMYIREEGGSS